jgi:hypothetical protein
MTGPRPPWHASDDHTARQGWQLITPLITPATTDLRARDGEAACARPPIFTPGKTSEHARDPHAARPRSPIITPATTDLHAADDQ